MEEKRLYKVEEFSDLITKLDAFIRVAKKESDAIHFSETRVLSGREIRIAFCYDDIG